MKEEEIMAKVKVEMFARREGKTVKLLNIAVIERMVEYTLEVGPIVNCDEYQVCYWCELQYSWSREDNYDHNPDCIWPILQEVFGQEDKNEDK